MTSYIEEKSIQALYSLVGGSDTIQNRICNAFSSSLILLSVERDIKESEKELFLEITNKLSTHENKQKGSIFASAEALNNEEAKDLARKMVSFCISNIHK